MTTNIPKPILLFDDNYILLSKRKFLVNNITIVLMARYISGLANVSQAKVYEDIIGRARTLSEDVDQELIDEHIARCILDSTPPDELG